MLKNFIFVFDVNVIICLKKKNLWINEYINMCILISNLDVLEIDLKKNIIVWKCENKILWNKSDINCI